MNTSKLVAIALFLSLGLGIPSTVSAGPFEDLKEAKREARAERKSFMEEIRERVSSKTGEMKRFLTMGRAAIGSGKITAKTDTSLTIEKDGTSYVVNIDSKTQFRRRFWGKAEFSEFQVGHVVNVIGQWTDDTHTAINAVLIRDLSIERRFGVFFGDVKSLLTNGWVMSAKSEKRPDQTVTVSSETKFTNRHGETITQGEVKVGHRVRVKGLWDKALNTVTEVTQVKDFSIPVVPTATVTATVTVTPTP